MTDTPEYRLIPLLDALPNRIESLLDAAFGADRFGRTAYKLRAGVDWIPAYSFGMIDDDGNLIGSIQCWPVALQEDGAEGALHPLIMVGPVAVSPDIQGKGLGKRLMDASLAAIDTDKQAAPQMMIGDPEYYGRFWGFHSDYTFGWVIDGPVERHRLLTRSRPGQAVPLKGHIVPRT